MALFSRRRPVSVEIRNYEDDFERPSWVKEHVPAVIVGTAVIIIAAVIGVIFFMMQKNSPINKFVSASSKTTDASFSFRMEAKYNNNSVMRYEGDVSADDKQQRVEIIYDADMGGYEYTNVIYTKDGLSYSGNYYNGQWTVSDCSTQIRDFFDFYTDYKRGDFDAGSLLRFLNLTSEYSSLELENFWDTLNRKLSTNNAVSNLTVSDNANSSTYTYHPDLEELFDLIIENGGPVFFNASAYNNFTETVENSRDIIKNSDLMMGFTIDAQGYLTNIQFQLETAGDRYEVSCAFENIGGADREIPDDFFTAAGIDR